MEATVARRVGAPEKLDAALAELRGALKVGNWRQRVATDP